MTIGAGLSPTLRDYIDWATGQGCAVQIRDVEREGRVFHAVLIQAATGHKAVEIAVELDAPLMSTTIARLDRRLGLKSHLFR